MSILLHTLTVEQIDTIVRAHLRALRPELRVSECDVLLVSGGDEGMQIEVRRRECHARRDPDPIPIRDTRWRPETVSA